MRHMGSSKEYNRQYYLKRRDELIKIKTEYQKEYSKTQMGRAQRQYQQYKRMDKRNGFDDVIDFDAKWIVDNIYTKPCVHCGETDWHKLGCNRINDNKPHTKDNVEPCCFHCNCVLNGINSAERVKKYGLKKAKRVCKYSMDDELLAVYCSTAEAERQTNISNGNISKCCRGAAKSAGGFKWKYDE